MKILVFSDSHQHIQFMKNAIDMHLAAGSVDCIFHLGDGVKDLESMSPHIPVCYVDGNYEEYVTNYIARKKLKHESLIELSGFRFFLTHGHRYGVKSGLSSLETAARKHNADVIIFGHTHEQYYEYISPQYESDKPLYIFNPGSISRPRDNKFSYGIIDIHNSDILITHATL